MKAAYGRNWLGFNKNEDDELIIHTSESRLL